MSDLSQKFTLDQIREFWSRQASEHGQSYAASWSDHRVIKMEIREILKYLADGDRVVDIGCANGYSTVQFASQKRIDIRGVDYIPEMIEQARTRLSIMADKLLGSVEFEAGDITSLSEPSGAYDKLIVIRVIINLHDWDTQKKGLRECARLLKPGGRLLLSEATVQGWQHLNKFRREWGLKDIPMPPFNQYIDEEKTIQAVAPDLRLVDLINFSSSYYVGTRVLKPLLIQTLGQTLSANINVADPEMEWNRWFSEMPSWGDYGTQKLFIFEKQ